MNLTEKKKAIKKLQFRAAINVKRAARIMRIILDDSAPDKKRRKALLLFFKISLWVRLALNRASIISSQPTKIAEGGFVRAGGELVPAMLAPEERVINGND